MIQCTMNDGIKNEKLQYWNKKNLDMIGVVNQYCSYCLLSLSFLRRFTGEFVHNYFHELR